MIEILFPTISIGKIYFTQTEVVRKRTFIIILHEQLRNLYVHSLCNYGLQLTHQWLLISVANTRTLLTQLHRSYSLIEFGIILQYLSIHPSLTAGPGLLCSSGYAEATLSPQSAPPGVEEMQREDLDRSHSEETYSMGWKLLREKMHEFYLTQ